MSPREQGASLSMRCLRIFNGGDFFYIIHLIFLVAMAAVVVDPYDCKTICRVSVFAKCRMETVDKKGFGIEIHNARATVPLKAVAIITPVDLCASFNVSVVEAFLYRFQNDISNQI